jgi:hypothetical protein
VKLTDTQLLLLSAASQHDDRALEPSPKLTGGAAGKVVAKLLTEGLSALLASDPRAILATAPAALSRKACKSSDLILLPYAPAPGPGYLHLLSWIVTLVNHPACTIAGNFLRLLLRLFCCGRLLDTSHHIRHPLAEAFGIKLPYEIRQRQLPWLLVMVVQLPVLRVHPKFTCHLHVLMRQVKLAPRVDPRLQASVLTLTFGAHGRLFRG